MLHWYRSQIKEFGWLTATRLLGRVAISRYSVNLANMFGAGKVECPCCGWRGCRFYDYIEVGYRIRNAACPRCDSHARHRMLHLWLSEEFKVQEKAGRALIFAPERALAPLWKAASRLRVLYVDLEVARGVDLRADLTRLPVVDDSIDLLWCHHVLEHIGDDRAAMRELHRILHPVTGELVVSVPMIPGTITCEYGFPKKEESGHWRIYGDDFVDRLTESGLTVERVKYSVLKGLQYGITSEENFYICRKAPSARSTLSLNRPAAAGPEGCLYS